MRRYKERQNCTTNKERDLKHREELKWFIIYLGLLIALLALFARAGEMTSYADEVILAEIPSNVGGEADDIVDSEVHIIDISDGGDSQSMEQSSSDIIYATDPVDGNDSLTTDATYDSSREMSDKNGGAVDSANENTGGRDRELEQTALSETVTASNGDEIYVPDSDDDCPVSSLVPLPVEVQEYIWNHCKKVTGDYKNYYSFILGAIQLESEFKRTAIHHNSNGSTDRGLMQINSCNIKECKRAGLITCTDDLWDIYKNIDCGFHEMNEYVRKFGVCESAYFAYNTGRTSGGSNKNSRVVMSNMAQWNTMLF